MDKGKYAGQGLFTPSLHLWVSMWATTDLTLPQPLLLPSSLPQSLFILIKPCVIHSYPQVTPTLGVFRYLILSLRLNSGGELVDLVVDRTALSHQLANLTVGVHNRGVVAASEGLSDLWQ